MLFMLHIDLTVPHHFTPEQTNDLRQRENAHALELIQQGTLLRIWRVVGTHSNYSLWSASTLEVLHATLAGLPMFPYLKIQVNPLIDHPLATACTSAA